MTTKIARMYDEERACRAYMGSIIEWKKTASLTSKTPKNKFTGNVKTAAMKIKKLYVARSPEEVLCKSAIKNSLDKRQEMISQLYK